MAPFDNLDAGLLARASRTDLSQATKDLLILYIIALEPTHHLASAQRPPVGRRSIANGFRSSPMQVSVPIAMIRVGARGRLKAMTP